ncbi:MAG: hypothetical protein JKY96_03165 [Phycisphaerales bacterium]|nr:hypothetical protein [Phycisphaerales bacterium]
MNTRILLIIVLTVLNLTATYSFAQSPSKSADPQSLKLLETQGIEAMGEGRYMDAAETFAEYIKLRPKSFVGYYNLAAALSRADEIDASMQAMTKAITIGFTDKRQMLRDPDLAQLRATPFFESLMESWDAVIQARREHDLAFISRLITRKMQRRTSEEYKLEIVSAHGQVATDQALAELDLLANWAIDELFVDERTPGYLDDLPWIMVALPDKRGFLSWAITVFGPGVRGNISSVGGAYEHQNRRLVAQDLGATYRHEFIHVLHWRDMSARGHNHAPWIQEGFASLVEDYNIVDAKLVPVPSWRTNIVKRLLKVHRLGTIETLASTPMQQFTSSRPLAKYAQARAVMLYVYENGKLNDFYQAYLQTYNSDPTGIKALEQAFNLEIDAIEKDYRKWIAALPTIPETGADLTATLGIGIKNGSGDGVLVSSLPGSSRRRTGLHTQEVITAINNRPTRDLFEFIRVLGDYRAGQTITLSTRRGIKHHQREVKLLAR